ncbi:MAG: zf-HC2 domain-containing protein [Thermodesulfobacteriota bacterium]
MVDCGTARRMIEHRADGLLPAEAGAELEAHLSACAACAAERRNTEAVGRMLRLHAAVSAGTAEPALDAMWTRVRAGIEEEKAARRAFPAWRWVWLPAAVALVVFGVLFYPTGTDRSPFNPRTFDVSVEDVESDIATVALVDKGEELPRVIWIIENAES